MKRKHVLSHEYLANVNSTDVSFETLYLSQESVSEVQDYSVPRNLFDFDSKWTRKIFISVLNENACTLEQFATYGRSAAAVDELWLVDERDRSENVIIREYADFTTKAYVSLFLTFGTRTVKHVIICS